MSRALAAELLKLRTTRTFVALALAALGLTLLVIVLVTSIDSEFDDETLREVFSFEQGGLFILLLGAIGMSGEWGHRTIAATVMSTPQRLRLMVAKVVAYSAAGALLSLVVTLAAMLVGSLILESRGQDTIALGDAIDVLWRNVLVAAFFGPFGVCVGTLVRNTPGVIVLLLAEFLIIERTLYGLAPKVGQFSPLVGAPFGVKGGDGEDFEYVLSTGVGVLVLCGWLAVLLAAATATLKHRDLV